MGALDGWRIALEIGHGWRMVDGEKQFDRGCSGPGPTYEYEISKWMGGQVKTLLGLRGAQADTIFTPVTLAERGQLAEGYHLFVSMHLNAFNGEVQGCEALVRQKDPRHKDIRLASCVSQRLAQWTQFRNRGAKKQELCVLRNVPESVEAACLAESFFLDSCEDMRQVYAVAAKAVTGLFEGIAYYCTEGREHPLTPEERKLLSL